MVSNATLRSSRIRMLRLPASEEKGRSFVNLRSADPMLWWERKPDGNDLWRLLAERWALSWEIKACSSNLDRIQKEYARYPKAQ